MEKPTKEDIENATDDQLNGWSAVWVMGWDKKTPAGPNVLTTLFGWFDNESRQYKYACGDWDPVRSIVQAFELEEKIKELKLRNFYSLTLKDVIWNETGLDTNSRSWWLLHATPRQRTKAALITIIERK